MTRNAKTSHNEKERILLKIPETYLKMNKNKMDCKLLMTTVHFEDDTSYFQCIFKTFMEIYRLNIQL